MGGIRRAWSLRTFVRLLPLLLIAGGVLYDVVTPRGFTAIPFFTAAPLVAAPFCALSGTVAVGAVSLIAAYAVHIRWGFGMDADTVTEVLTVVTVAVLAVALNRVVRRGDLRLAIQREIAVATQRAVLPEPMERLGGYEIAARYEAAQADAYIGGDLYAVQDSAYGVRVVVGDVRGKGMGAVAAVAVVVGAFREAAEQEPGLEAVARRLERALVREGSRRDGIDAVEGFTTAVLAELPHGDGPVRVVNRGHPPPLLLHPDGTVRPLRAREPALPLGMSDLGDWPDRVDEAPFPPGTTLLLHTDGLSEARNAQGVFFDPERRLDGRVFRDPGALIRALAEEVRVHCGGGMADDMALLAVRRPRSSPGVIGWEPSA
ncbi:PP2C family protein-serine/threonine phosphatase [Streptomyces sp. YS415]|uniref:PP2C family protein-serine/threonine phosphatase n=1 Tax=Streptomyces sp. YS415 TaxID=2944806 RepID=UPI00201FC47B|nr:PP2C family protein-serine/threonine phosphatase [Streptomyces sp. YS415]MCL7430055.1 serine/threonine-protein phosphatase [Streptomyces sp. YS415]